ncbi:hypothetical protein D9O50_01675 [Oxalobacteraceae bacterium CAVE-383]|nr:hypothetical protein D9O50_01675 [Oxalobacteraceae bacterium CAVE-383]
MNVAITHFRSFCRHGARLLLVACGGMTLCVAANLANAAGGNSKDIEANYRRERASCMDGTSNEDRATCLREAAAARDEARRGQLTDDSAAERQNAVARCNGLPESDRADCVRRVQGEGTVSGSVGGGGIFRETVTTVPASPAPAPMPAGSAP